MFPRFIAGIAFFAALCSSSMSAFASVAGADGSGAQGATWRDPVVRLSVDESILRIHKTAFDVVVDSVVVWQNLNDRIPTLVVEHGTADAIGYRKGGQNTNTVRFVPGGSEMANGALAITVLTFDLEADRILDADIVINGQHAFSTDELPEEMRGAGIYDLQNVLSHEVGHFLGLGEEYEDTTATMYAYSVPGETRKRDLELRDVVVIDELYNLELDTEPGFSCGVVTAESNRSMALSLVLLLGGTWLIAFRRRGYRRAVSVMTLALLAGGSAQGVSEERMTVSALSSQWEGGVVITQAELRPVGCADCTPEQVTTYGGRVGNIVQQVGGLRPLRVGDKLTRHVRNAFRSNLGVMSGTYSADY